MKSILDSDVRRELLSRIEVLTADHKAQWGKMNAYQMVKHCTLCDDMYHGDLKIKRAFIGRLIGPSALKQVLKDDSPFMKNRPTGDPLKTTSFSGDFDNEKKEWKKRLDKYADFGVTNFIHPFFGPMTREQIGFIAYKHADHHLRQFGV